MNNQASLFFAAIFGLIAGMGHGVVSHYQELPFSLSEQVIESISGNSFN
ncbi:MAG: hypothetical protein AAF652_02545 [Cyanobacteria bacterium P01_C01_bin.72]